MLKSINEAYATHTPFSAPSFKVNQHTPRAPGGKFGEGTQHRSALIIIPCLSGVRPIMSIILVSAGVIGLTRGPFFISYRIAIAPAPDTFLASIIQTNPEIIRAKIRRDKLIFRSIIHRNKVATLGPSPSEGIRPRHRITAHEVVFAVPLDNCFTGGKPQTCNSAEVEQILAFACLDELGAKASQVRLDRIIADAGGEHIKNLRGYRIRSAIGFRGPGAEDNTMPAFRDIGIIALHCQHFDITETPKADHFAQIQRGIRAENSDANIISRTAVNRIIPDAENE